jgi:hypothetical protein
MLCAPGLHELWNVLLWNLDVTAAMIEAGPSGIVFQG